MRLVPEYEPVEKLYLSFVHQFFNTRFKYGKTICEIAKAAGDYVAVEIFVSPLDLPHLQAAFSQYQVDPSTVTLNHDSPRRGIMAEYAPIVAENDAGERFGLIFRAATLDRADELKDFAARFASSMGLTPLDIRYDFGTAQIAVSHDVVLLSKTAFDGADGQVKLDYFVETFPEQSFYIVPALEGERTGDLDMYLWPIAPETWIISEYPAHTPEADSILPALKILQAHGHTVHRAPGLDHIVYDDVDTTPNYANGVMLNQAALVPAYGHKKDTVVAEILQDCGYHVFQIDCSDVILSNSGLHCISRTLPKFKKGKPNGSSKTKQT